MDFSLMELEKGLGKAKDGEPINWKLGSGHVSLPASGIILSNLRHNIQWMDSYIKFSNEELRSDKINIFHSPHVKTTMSPDIITLQLEDGHCWGVTTANAQQTLLVHRMTKGKNVLMANQLVGQRNMEIVSQILKSDPSFQFYCLIDSVENIMELTSFFKGTNQALNVLIEIGVIHGRTGIRSANQLKEVIEALQTTAKDVLIPKGIEFFEGILKNVEDVKLLCNRSWEATEMLCEKFPFMEEVIVSGGGSAFYDVVLQQLVHYSSSDSSKIANPIRIILRPGSYVTHDAGIYKDSERRIQGSCSIAKKLGLLRPALKVFGYIQSTPESNLAIVGIGRRDVGEDAGLPIPFQLMRKRNLNVTSIGIWESCPASWKTFKIMDQHCFVRIEEEDEVEVGDIVVFDISHPCTTFQAWKHLLLLDEFYNVLDIFKTYF